MKGGREEKKTTVLKTEEVKVGTMQCKCLYESIGRSPSGMSTTSRGTKGPRVERDSMKVSGTLGKCGRRCDLRCTEKPYVTEPCRPQ